MSLFERHLKVSKTDDRVTIAAFLDREVMESEAVAAIQKELTRLVDETTKIKLLLDFTSVEFISSLTLGMLVTVAKHVKKSQGQLRLCSLNRQLCDVIEAMALQNLFTISPTQQTAIKSFEKSEIDL